MSKEIIKEGKEALERALLMMKYDMKKTLTENVKVVSEQVKTDIKPGDLADFVDDAVDILDRDVETSDMEELIELMKTEIFGKTFKGKCAYDAFKKYYADNESWQGETFEDQVNSSGEYNEQEFDDVKQEMLDLIKKEKQFCQTLSYTTVTTTKQITQSNTKIDTSCLSSLKSTGANKVGCPTYVINGQNYAFCVNGRANGPDGMANWSCSGGKVIYKGKTIYSGGSGQGSQFKSCSGTYTQGCKSGNIRKVQACLGVKTTGNFGPLTQKALSSIGYSKGFSDSDINTICNKKANSNLLSSNLVTAEKGL
jgi:gas vesicle protein